MYNMTTSIKKITWCCGVLLLWMPAVWGNVGTVEYYATAYGVPDASVTQAECQAYGGGMYNGQFSTDDGPPGCMKLNGFYWYNTGTGDCSTGYMCIKTKKQLMFPTFETHMKLTGQFALTAAECEQYAMSVGASWENRIGQPNGPTGCGLYSNSNIVYWFPDGIQNCEYDGITCIHKAPFERVSGAATDVMSQTECQAYGKSIGKWSIAHDWGNMYPIGCFIDNSGFVYFNTATSSTDICDGLDRCLIFSRGDAYEQTSGAPDLSMSQVECEAYANNNPNYSFETISTTANPIGCIRYYSSNTVKYATAGTWNCANYLCLQKPIIVPVVWEVTSGAPDLSMTEGECQAHAGGSWGGGVDNAAAAPGCITFSSYYWYNTGSGECSSDYKCLQKASAVEVIESGTPDLSMTEGECEAYGVSIGKWDSAAGSSGKPKGCFDAILEGGKVRYNNDASGGDCDVNSYFRCLQKVEVRVPCGADHVYDVAADTCTSAVGKMLTTDGTTWVDVPVGAVRTGEDTWATGNAAIESAWYSHAYCDSQAKAEENYHPDDPVSATPAALDATTVGLILATNDPIAWYQPQVGKVYLGNGVFLDCPIYSMRVGNSCSDQKAAFENAWDSQCA
jgi:hypothetical protein